jgi:redox-sensitive bicupin YhaK (pirin superfamily)
MSAGSGITHSEFNALSDAPTHLLQIWIMPHTKNVKPSYDEWKPDGSQQKDWVCVASEEGRDGGVAIHQDARLYLTHAQAGESREVSIPAGRYGYLHIAKGAVECGGHTLAAGDAMMFVAGDVSSLSVSAAGEFLLFDLS